MFWVGDWSIQDLCIYREWVIGSEARWIYSDLFWLDWPGKTILCFLFYGDTAGHITEFAPLLPIWQTANAGATALTRSWGWPGEDGWSPLQVFKVTASGSTFVLHSYFVLTSFLYIFLRKWQEYLQQLASFGSFFPTFYLFFFIFNFTILYWFCHISTWICCRYTRDPHPEPLIIHRGENPLLPGREWKEMVSRHQKEIFQHLGTLFL